MTATELRIQDLVDPELVFVDVDGHSRDSLLRWLSDKLSAHTTLDGAEIFQGLLEREALGSTGLGGGIAIPHCRIAKVKEPLLAVALTPQGIDFNSVDGKPVQVVFVVVTSKSDPQQNLRCLSAISRWARVPGNVERLLEVPTPVAVVEALHSGG